jgi:hypothetical protein
VLSPRTERVDRGHKLEDYQELPSLQEYVLVSSRYQFVEIFRQQLDGQWSYEALRPDQTIKLQSLGLEISFAELYADVPVPVKPTVIKEAPTVYSYAGLFPAWLKMSVDEYLKFDKTSAIRYEYFEGYAVAKEGDTLDHIDEFPVDSICEELSYPPEILKLIYESAARGTVGIQDSI